MCLPTGSPQPFAWSTTRGALCTRFGVRPASEPAPQELAPVSGEPLSPADLEAMLRTHANEA